MVAARRLLGERAECKHIITMPCMMHGFALILKSALAHPTATQAIASIQRVVTFFQSSHQPLAFLQECAKAAGIATGLQTSNHTRITSVHYCLESVLKLEGAFKKLLDRKNDNDFPPTLKEPQKRWLLELLDSRRFWAQLEALCKLLQPLTKVIMAVQGAHTTLADLAR